MRLIAILFLVPFTAFANPGVKAGTDIGKNKVKKHYQVTWSKDAETTQVASVTEFKKPVKEEYFRQECFISVKGTKRFSNCVTRKVSAAEVAVQSVPRGVDIVASVPARSSVSTVRPLSQNTRLMFHAGYGPTGLKVSETNNATSVKEDRGVILGIGLSQHVGYGLNLGVSIFSNESIMATIGVDLQPQGFKDAASALK